MIHELKTWVEYFEEIFTNKKKFEVRLNDRDFHVGDYLILKEFDYTNFKDFDSVEQAYTGRECYRKVTYVLHGSDTNVGVELGYVVMSINMCDKAEIKEIELELRKGLKSIQ